MNVTSVPGFRALFLTAVALLCGLAAPVGAAHAQEAGKVYAAGELTTTPSVKSPTAAAAVIDRNYPSGLRSVGGKVQLRFVVQPNGKVDSESIEVVVATASQLSDAARKAIQQIEFTPGKVNGTPVASVVLFPITYASR